MTTNAREAEPLRRQAEISVDILAVKREADDLLDGLLAPKAEA